MLRCAVCRTRRATFASMLAHRHAAQHVGPCTCPGYHYPHRSGSECCDAHPYADYNRAKRAGAKGDDLLDAFIHAALFGEHKLNLEKEAPF